VLSAFPALALQCAPGFDPAPALHAVAVHAAAEHPRAWAWDGCRAEARQLGAAVTVVVDPDGSTLAAVCRTPR